MYSLINIILSHLYITSSFSSFFCQYSIHVVIHIHTQSHKYLYTIIIQLPDNIHTHKQNFPRATSYFLSLLRNKGFKFYDRTNKHP